MKGDITRKEIDYLQAFLDDFKQKHESQNSIITLLFSISDPIE